MLEETNYNYSENKKQIEVVRKMRTTAVKEVEWTEKVLKAIYLIYSGISNDQLQLIKNGVTTYEIIETLGEMFLRESQQDLKYV